MTLSKVTSTENLSLEHNQPVNYASFSPINANAVSWAAILAGATVAAALSLILLLLGAGLGLSSVSPWAHKGVSATTFGVSTIVWLTVTQILATGMGGFLAGRLRVKWDGVPMDEVYFRDTAHGFLVWAVASLATAALLTSAIGAIVNGGVQATASLASEATKTMTGNIAATGSGINKTEDASVDEAGAMNYFVDSLFRKVSDPSSASSSEPKIITTDTSRETLFKAEVSRVFIYSISKKTMPPADITYISQIVSGQTGLTQQEAEKRVNDVYSNMQIKKQNAEIVARNIADKARKASIYTTLWLFVSLLMGAFSASLAATWGGRCRDA